MILIADATRAGNELARGLREDGLDVVVVMDPVAALECAQERRPTLALVELRLGEFSGLDLLEALRQASPSTRIIIMTMYGSIDSARVALSRGADDYLTKPVMPQEIKALRGAELLARSGRMLEMRRSYIEEVLVYCGSLSKASRVLRVDRRSLRRMRLRLGIKP